MSLRIVAAAFEDGWCFVRHGESLLLVRPSYRSEDVLAVEEATLQRALRAGGFTATDLEFETWKDLIIFLEERLVEASRQHGVTPATRADVRALVERAPREVLAGYLSRIRNELIPCGQTDAALELLAVLAKAAVGQRYLDLAEAVLATTIDLASTLGPRERHEGLHREARRDDLLARFPKAVRAHGEDALIAYADRVRETRHVMPIGVTA